MKILLTSFYNIVLALWVGGMFIYTFLVTPTIFKSYSRVMAGEIVGHLFAWYFKYNLTLTTTALILLFFIKAPIKWLMQVSLVVLILAVCLNIAAVTVIHPKTKKIKQEIHNAAPESDDWVKARKAFAKMHVISMIINLIIICAGIAMIVLNTYGAIKGQIHPPGGL